jgi:hypothetical protein
MWWLAGIGTYILFLALAWVFLRGATVRECPKPQQATADLELLPQMQSEPIVSAMAFAQRRQSVWETDISYSHAP